MDVDARMQLFDFKTKYEFQTIPGVADYNIPLYPPQASTPQQDNLQSTITPFPVYQGFLSPCSVNGIPVGFSTVRDAYWQGYPTYLQALPQVATGDGTTTNFNINLPFFPAIPGHVDITGIIATNDNIDPIFGTTLDIRPPPTSVYPGIFITYTNANGSNVTIVDSGQFFSGGTNGDLYGLLMVQGTPGASNVALSGGYTLTPSALNLVNYNTGEVNVTFTDSTGSPIAPPAGTPIQAQCYFYEQGIPRSILFWNNCITIRPPPNTQYLVEMTGYLTPAAFLSTSQSIPFAYMAEYVARGSARKILADTGDVEQFQFYEPLFREQEILVWKRSQRIFTSSRTPTIYEGVMGPSPNNSSMGAF